LGLHTDLGRHADLLVQPERSAVGERRSYEGANSGRDAGPDEHAYPVRCTDRAPDDHARRDACGSGVVLRGRRSRDADRGLR
jgi:hypothetical protein